LLALLTVEGVLVFDLAPPYQLLSALQKSTDDVREKLRASDRVFCVCLSPLWRDWR
jgi:hypothetical protein